MQSRSPLHPASHQRWMAATTCPHDPHQQQSTTYRAAATHPKSLKNIDWALLDHVLTSHGFVRRSDITSYGQLPASDTGASAGSPTTTTVSSRNALTFVQQTGAVELTTDNIHVFRHVQPHVSIDQPPQRQQVPEGRQQAIFQDKALEHMLLQKQQQNGSQNVLLQHNLLQSGRTQQVVQHLHVAAAARAAGRRSQQGLQLSHSRFHYQQQQHPPRLDARPAVAGCRRSTHQMETAAVERVGPRMKSVTDQAVSSQPAADSYITLWFQKQAVQQQLAQLQEQEQDLQSHMRLLVQQMLQQQGGSKAQVHLLLQHTLLKIQQSQQQGVTSPDADDGDSTDSVRPAKRRRQSDTGSSSAGPSLEEEEDQQTETDIAAALLGLQRHELLPQ